ncbi:Uncharacterised protein [Shigella sonnei]|nr:Uncharacterised protein [Shigella sonnei]
MPFTFSCDIPGGIYRCKTAFSPVAPLPAARVREKIIRQPIHMQHEIAQFIFMRLQNGLQTSVNTTLGDFYTR